MIGLKWRVLLRRNAPYARGDRAENDGDKQLRNWAQQQLNTDVGDPKHRPEQADITPQQEPQLD